MFVRFIRDKDYKTIGLLVASQKQISAKYWLPTYGEQFLFHYRIEFFQRIRIVLVRDFVRVDRDLNIKKCVMRSSILTCRSCLRSQKVCCRCEINSENLCIDFECKRFRKRGCKKIVDHYNAIPSLKQLIARLGFDQRTLIFDFVGWFTRSHNFSQLPGSLLR